MDQNDDCLFDMGEEQLSDKQVEQLLRGEVDPSLSTGPLAHLAELILAAKMPATSEELSLESSVLAGFKEVLGKESAIDIANERKRRLHSNLLAAKAAGILIAATALTGTAVAAYHGDLPNTFQATLSSGLARVGINVPASNASGSQSFSTSIELPKATNSSPKTGRNAQTGAATTGGQHASPITGASGGPANDSALYGQCTAYFEFQRMPESSTSTTSGNAGSNGSLLSESANGSGSVTSTTLGASFGSSRPQLISSTAFQRLQELAHTEGKSVAQLCAGAATPGAAGASQNNATANGNGFGNRSSGQNQRNSSRFNFDSSFINPFSTTSTTTVFNFAGGGQRTAHSVGATKGSESSLGSSLNEGAKRDGSSNSQESGSSQNRSSQ